MSKKRRRFLKTSPSQKSRAAVDATQTPRSSPETEPETSTETEAVSQASTETEAVSQGSTEARPSSEAPATPSPTGQEIESMEQPSDAPQPTQDERDAEPVAQSLSSAEPEDVPAEETEPDQANDERGADAAAATPSVDEPDETVEPPARDALEDATAGEVEVEAEPATGTRTRAVEQVNDGRPAPQSPATPARAVPEQQAAAGAADELEHRRVDGRPDAVTPVEAPSRDEALTRTGGAAAPEPAEVGPEAVGETESVDDRQPEVVSEQDRTARIAEDEAAPEVARTEIEPEPPGAPESSRALESSTAAPPVTAPVPVGVSEPEQEGDEAPGGPVAKPAEGVAAWRRLFRMGQPRATKANVLGALLAVLLGLAIATQVQLTQERGLSELSQTDLIRVLDDLSVRSSRLDDQIRELEATRDRLKSGTGSSAEALAQAQKRADSLGILAGTVGATGPGITVSLSDPDRALTGPIVLDLIQELRDAGAEAIEVGGVRVVASSFIGEIDGDITVDGVRVSRPITIKAIGDSDTLSSAMTIPGGIVETVRQKGATAKVTKQATVQITALHEAKEPKHAQPAG